MAPRWLVGYAQAALARAEATRKNAPPRAHEALTTPLLPRQAQRLCAPAAAPEPLAAGAQRWKSHRVASAPRPAHHRSVGTGRPTPRPPLTASEGPIQAPVQTADEARERDKHATAGFGLGPHIDASAGRETAVLGADTGQAQVEGGVRFLTAPRFFVASWCVNKPTRIAGGLLVRTLAVLGDSVAPRRLRKQ
jgi:hypothetical protein